MNNIAMNRPYLRQARKRSKHVKKALENANYLYIAQKSQEATELSLKAALRLVGIEPIKWHDLIPVLGREAGRFLE